MEAQIDTNRGEALLKYHTHAPLFWGGDASCSTFVAIIGSWGDMISDWCVEAQSRHGNGCIFNGYAVQVSHFKVKSAEKKKTLDTASS